MTEHEEKTGEPRRPRVVDKRVAHGGASAAPASPPPTPAAPPPATPPEPAPAPAPSEPAPETAFTGPDGQVWTPEQEAEARKMAQEIADTPAIEWVVNSAVSLANIAATKLDLGHPADAGLAIDALAGILKEVGHKLGNVEQPLRQTLAQLQMAFAERATGGQPPAAP
jgi:hypothetical protein